MMFKRMFVAILALAALSSCHALPYEEDGGAENPDISGGIEAFALFPDTAGHFIKVYREPKITAHKPDGLTVISSRYVRDDMVFGEAMLDIRLETGEPAAALSMDTVVAAFNRRNEDIFRDSGYAKGRQGLFTAKGVEYRTLSYTFKEKGREAVGKTYIAPYGQSGILYMTLVYFKGQSRPSHRIEHEAEAVIRQLSGYFYPEPVTLET